MGFNSAFKGLSERPASSQHYWDTAQKALNLTTEMVKVKVSFNLEQATKALRWSKDIALLFL
jgi:hypothetical protein